MSALLAAINPDHLIGFFIGACTGITIFSIVFGLAEMSAQREIRKTLERNRAFRAEAEPKERHVSRRGNP